jgi:hypothetical protein
VKLGEYFWYYLSYLSYLSTFPEHSTAFLRNECKENENINDEIRLLSRVVENSHSSIHGLEKGDDGSFYVAK